MSMERLGYFISVYEILPLLKAYRYGFLYHQQTNLNTHDVPTNHSGYSQYALKKINKYTSKYKDQLATWLQWQQGCLPGEFVGC